MIVWFLLASIAGLTERLEWLQYLSPYYYSDAQEVLTTGVVWWHLFVNLGLAAGRGWLAIRSFAGREIAVVRWQLLAWTSHPRLPDLGLGRR